MLFGDSEENVNDKNNSLFFKMYMYNYSFNSYYSAPTVLSFVQMKTHTCTQSQFTAWQDLFLPHTVTECDESSLVPGTVLSTSGAHTHGLTPSLPPLWKVCSLIEHYDIRDPIPVDQTQAIQLGASWHSHAQF